MTRHEYKTVELPFKWGVFRQGSPDIETVLNTEGKAGWRLKQAVAVASSNFGQSNRIIMILERELNA